MSKPTKTSKDRRSNSRNVDWFSRGRDAFTEGKKCFIDDARIRGDQRQNWYDGWNHQALLNSRSKTR